MKRRVLLRLYPRAWRARYGDELEALVGDRLSLRATIDIVRAALVERGDQLMGKNRSSDQPSVSVFYGVGELAREMRHELRASVPWRAAAPWGIALGATFVIDGSFSLLYPAIYYPFRSHWSDLAGVGICFCAGFVPAWRRRDFGHGGVTCLVAILIGFFVAIVGDVAAVLVISRFRNFDLATQLYWAIEVPLPVMLMLGGSIGTIGAAIAAGLCRVRGRASGFGTSQ